MGYRIFREGRNFRDIPARPGTGGRGKGRRHGTSPRRLSGKSAVLRAGQARPRLPRGHAHAPRPAFPADCSAAVRGHAAAAV